MSELICQCGCGEVIPPKPSHRRYTPRYIQKHFLRISKESRLAKAQATKTSQRKTPPDGWVAPSGFCECGCGSPTKMVLATNVPNDRYKGYPMRYLRGHSPGHRATGPDSRSWRGGRFQHKTGYIYVFAPDHPRANASGYVLEHRLVYEATHGIVLDKTQIIHHINGIRNDNSPENLFVTTNSEHSYIHDALAVYREKNPETSRIQASLNGKKGAAVRWSKILEEHHAATATDA